MTENLDKWIAEHIMGWHYEQGPPYRGGDAMWCLMPKANAVCDVGEVFIHQWHPTESISGAFQVVEKMMEKFPDWFFTLDIFGKNYGHHDYKNQIVATFQESADAYIVHSCVGAETVPLAICLACKMAVEDMK